MWHTQRKFFSLFLAHKTWAPYANRFTNNRTTVVIGSFARFVSNTFSKSVHFTSDIFLLGFTEVSTSPPPFIRIFRLCLSICPQFLKLNVQKYFIKEMFSTTTATERKKFQRMKQRITKRSLCAAWNTIRLNAIFIGARNLLSIQLLKNSRREK